MTILWIAIGGAVFYLILTLCLSLLVQQIPRLPAKNTPAVQAFLGRSHSHG